MKNNWQIKKLNEIAIVSSGNSAPQKKTYFDGGIYPFFRTSDVGAVHLSKSLSETRDYLNDEGIKNLKLFTKNTILFPKSGASTFLNHRVIMGCDGYVSSHLATITPNINYVLPKYLYYFLTTVDAKEIAPNSAYPSLKIFDIGNIKIPLQSIENQEKIVKILDEKFEKLNEAKKIRRDAILNTEKILSKMFDEIFNNKINKNCLQKEIQEIASVNPIKTEIKNYSDNMIISFVPMASVSDISQSIEKQEEKKLGEVRNGYTYFKRNDIILAKVTPCMENGKIAFANNLKNEVGFGSSEFHVIRAKKEFIIAEYIYHILRQKKFRDIAETKMTGTSGLKRVPKDFIEKYKIPLPSIEEQKKIVKKLDSFLEKINKLKKLYNSQLEDFDKLEKSYLKEAFSGDLI